MRASYQAGIRIKEDECDKMGRKSRAKINEADIMTEILEVRYSDLEKEKELCYQLLESCKSEQYNYGRAFANVYLFDSLLALGEYSSSSRYLSQALYLCKENQYEDLLIVLSNLAGLYYLKLNDEQTAVEYFLEGLELAERMGDYEMCSKFYNNIGMGFAGRGDWPSAKDFFAKAYEGVAPYMADGGKEQAISYLGNLAEACREQGDIEGEERALKLSVKFANDRKYYKLRIGCGWCAYYSAKGDREKCLAELGNMRAIGLNCYENKYFVCDMMIGLIENMMDIKEYEVVEQLLQELNELGSEEPIIVRYRTQCLRIQYLEAAGKEKELDRAYADYYKIVCETSSMDDQVKTESMLSKIQLNHVLSERERIRKEKEKLEDVNQLDELTGVYNRRHFNKLVSKAEQRKDIKTLGVIMLDVDYFKQYNDLYGHFEGDKALKAVAKVLNQNTTEGIYAGRYGGDEFVCICVDVTDRDIEAYIKKSVEELEESNIAHEGSKCSDRITLSIGYSNEKVEVCQDGGKLLQLADEALYQAKELGRNGSRRKSLFS